MPLLKRINHFKSGRKRNHMQAKCSLRGKIQRAGIHNQLLKLGTNVPSAPYLATFRLIVQLRQFPLIYLTLRALGAELLHVHSLKISFSPSCLCPGFSSFLFRCFSCFLLVCLILYASCIKIHFLIFFTGEQGYELESLYNFIIASRMQ